MSDEYYIVVLNLRIFSYQTKKMKLSAYPAPNTDYQRVARNYPTLHPTLEPTLYPTLNFI